jgi:hypothetical protein
LQQAEVHAQALGLKINDGYLSQEELIAWYKRHGYIDNGEKNLFSKRYSYFNRKTAFGIYRAREKNSLIFRAEKNAFALLISMFYITNSSVFGLFFQSSHNPGCGLEVWITELRRAVSHRKRTEYPSMQLVPVFGTVCFSKANRFIWICSTSASADNDCVLCISRE